MADGTLYHEWQNHNDRPAWVRENADRIDAAVDTSEPVPTGELADVRDWVDRFKSTVSKQLQPDDGGSE
jgi:hypothetical protein